MHFLQLVLSLGCMQESVMFFKGNSQYSYTRFSELFFKHVCLKVEPYGDGEIEGYPWFWTLGQGFRQKLLCHQIGLKRLWWRCFFFYDPAKYWNFKYRQTKIPMAWKMHSNILLGRGWSKLSAHETQWKKKLHCFDYKSYGSWLFRMPCQKKQLCITSVKASCRI